MLDGADLAQGLGVRAFFVPTVAEVLGVRVSHLWNDVASVIVFDSDHIIDVESWTGKVHLSMYVCGSACLSLGQSVAEID